MIKAKRKRDWELDCKAFMEKLPRVTVIQETINKINKFCDGMIDAKMDEGHYQKDNDQMGSRFQTGFLGEAAANQFLGIDSQDFTISNSKKYDVSDIDSLGIGVKTADWFKYHVVHKNGKRPEIMMVRYDETTFLVCGLATVEILQAYQDDKLILNHKLRAKGTKTGFYGYEHLLKFNNLDELKALL